MFEILLPFINHPLIRHAIWWDAFFSKFDFNFMLNVNLAYFVYLYQSGLFGNQFLHSGKSEFQFEGQGDSKAMSILLYLWNNIIDRIGFSIFSCTVYFILFPGLIHLEKCLSMYCREWWKMLSNEFQIQSSSFSISLTPWSRCLECKVE